MVEVIKTWTEFITDELRQHERKVGPGVELRLCLFLESDGMWAADIQERCDGWSGQIGTPSWDPETLLSSVYGQLPEFLDYYVGSPL